MEVGVKSDVTNYTEVAVANHCVRPYSYVDDDDDIICLDVDEIPASLTKNAHVQETSRSRPPQFSRLLLQIIRLHLSEQCMFAGCSAVLNETESLRKKVRSLEDLGDKMRKVCTSQQVEIARLREENDKQKKRITMMEGVVRRQGALIRDYETQMNFLQNTAARPPAPKQPDPQPPKSANASPLVTRPMNNNVHPEVPTVVQKKTRSDVHPSNMPSAALRRNVLQQEKTPIRINGAVHASQQPSRVPSVFPTPSATRTPITAISPKCGRIKVDVPHVPTVSLIDFSAPISCPLLEYPIEYHRCKLALPSDFSLEIMTEPSNFLLTKKVQGVIKYAILEGALPKKLRVFCYMESAVKVRKWTSSMVYTFVNAHKIKFDIVFSKEQQIARFDRVVVFGYVNVGNLKYITSREVLNVGQQSESDHVIQKDKHVDSAPKTAVPMETEATQPPPIRRSVTSSGIYDSNFEVYRP